MSELSLRPYQSEAVDVIARKLRRGGTSLMLQAPTGAGKSEIGIAVIRRMLESDRVRRVLVISPRRYLIEQLVNRAGGYGLSVAEVIDQLPKSGDWPESVDVLSAHQSAVFNRLGLRDLPDLLIVDEAHGAFTVDGAGVYNSREPALSRLARTVLVNGGRLLGMTATPWRLVPDEGFDSLFDSMHQCPIYDQLVDDGYLTPIRVLDHQRITVEGVKLVRGEYSEEGLRSQNSAVNLVDEPVADAVQLGLCTPQRPTLVFCINREHAVEVGLQLQREHGIEVGLDFSGMAEFRGTPCMSCDIADAEVEAYTDRVPLGCDCDWNCDPGCDCDCSCTPSDYDQLAVFAALGKDAHRAFAESRLHCIVSVHKYLEGVDLPRVQGIVDLAPTKSQSRWRQKAGRASRVSDDGAEALVLDAVSNCRRLGSPTGPYDWTLRSQSADEVEAQIVAAGEERERELDEREAKLSGWESELRDRAASSGVQLEAKFEWRETRAGDKYFGPISGAPAGWAGNGLLTPSTYRGKDQWAAMLFLSKPKSVTEKCGFHNSRAEAEAAVEAKLAELMREVPA